MTVAERIQLKSMIRGLPRKNLEHIADLVERNKPVNERSSVDISVDLEKEVFWTVHVLSYARLHRF